MPVSRASHRQVRPWQARPRARQERLLGCYCYRNTCRRWRWRLGRVQVRPSLGQRGMQKRAPRERAAPARRAGSCPRLRGVRFAAGSAPRGGRRRTAAPSRGTRRRSMHAPVQVVASKGALGAAVTSVAALVTGESRPTSCSASARLSALSSAQATVAEMIATAPSRLQLAAEAASNVRAAPPKAMSVSATRLPICSL